MPRDSGGVYTLPAGNPVVSGTVIASSWANPTMDDLGAALTDSLSRTGNGGMQSAFKNINGVETSPSDTFNNDPLTGRYLFAAGDMRDTVSGVDQVRYTPQGLSVTDGEGGWTPVLGSGSGAILIQTDFTNVAGQTVFTTAEANSSADAYINGSLLANDDYTFTLGNTITLVEAVKNASDVVSILGYGAFDITDPAGARAAIDVYSTEESDAGNRNYLINGEFDIWQRGGGPFVSGYAADRWRILTGVSSVDQQIADASVPTSKYALRLYRDVSGSASIVQRIEALNSDRLAGSTATFSLKPSITSGAVDSISVTLSYATVEDDFTAVTAIETVTINAPVMDGSLLEFNFSALPDTVKNGVQVAIEVANSSSADVKLHEAQLNTGAIAKPFIYTPVGETLALCQRYYQTTTNSGDWGYGWSGVTVSGATYIINTRFVTTMRDTPEVVLIGIAQTAFPVTVPTAALSVGTGGFRENRAADAANNGGFFAVDYTANAEL